MMTESPAYEALRWGCFSRDREALDGPDPAVFDALGPDERVEAAVELSAGLRDDDPRPALALAALGATAAAPRVAALVASAAGREDESHARASIDLALALWLLSNDAAAIEHHATVLARNRDAVIRMIASANLGRMRHARSVEVIAQRLVDEDDPGARYNLARSTALIYGLSDDDPEVDAHLRATARATGHARPAARDALFAWIAARQ